MKEIKLTQNKVALVDDDDYEILSHYKWHAAKNRETFYASRKFYHISIDGKRKQKTFNMHDFIMMINGKLFKNCKMVDHIDGNGLNNQKSNLRIANHQQNAANRKPYKKGTSKHKGVSWDKSRKKWRSSITYNDITFELGFFNTEEEAAYKYNKKAKKIFGQFARLNKVQIKDIKNKKSKLLYQVKLKDIYKY